MFTETPEQPPFLARRDEASWCATLAESYDHIGQAWAKALQGFDLDLVKG